MARIVFAKNDQNKFLTDLRTKSGLSNVELAKIAGISDRTFRDWIKEKFYCQKSSIIAICDATGLPFPKNTSEIENWWSGRVNGRLGGISRMKKHGPPGTPEGRIKGGRVSQVKRRANPEYYRKLGCNVAKDYIWPKKSSQLAEFVGICLGDGAITRTQIHITLNSIADKDYVTYVNNLVFSLFSAYFSCVKRKNANAIEMWMNGVNLVAYMKKIGMVVGNKVKNQVGVPSWIQRNNDYSKMCVRGLMDTDGGIFVHSYKINNKEYRYLKLAFSNMSKPLLRFVHKTLTNFGFHPKYSGGNKVWLYSEPEVRKYLEIVGSSNHRLLRRLEV